MPGYHTLRLPDRYRALLELSSVGFAWEWLRRNPEYRALWATAPADAIRASAQARASARRNAGVTTTLRQHPLGRRAAHLGLTFPGSTRSTGDRPATDRVGA
ncbi:transcriptional regulator domain-containing protein [Sphingomonas sp. TF3]|uniref:transcriptional regulator domain-containing protein n=1 Tax=Sphingomonas sp. TF3 TaxID=2495580 RepID=UPI001C8D6DF1